MAEAMKFNLPKVRLRIKTTPTQTIQQQTYEHSYKQYAAAPPVFKERLKMGKEIQDVFIRFRKRKRNNYMQRLNSTKKNVPIFQQKRNSTIQMKNKTKNMQYQTKFALQVDTSTIQQGLLIGKQDRQSLTVFTQKVKSSPRCRQIFTGSFKHPSTKNHYLSRNHSLHDSDIRCQENVLMELQGKKCNFMRCNESKKMLQFVINNNKSRQMRVNKSGQSSSFQIDGWKADRFSGFRNYYDCQTLQIEG